MASLLSLLTTTAVASGDIVLLLRGNTIPSWSETNISSELIMACRKEERPDLRGSSLKMDEGKPAGGRNGGNPVGFWESSALILLSFYLFIYFFYNSFNCLWRRLSLEPAWVYITDFK